MTISLSEQDWTDLEEEAYSQKQYVDPADQQDIVLPLPAYWAEGNIRHIMLRDGLSVQIDQFQMRDRSQLAYSERQHGVISFHCHLSGEHQDRDTKVGNAEYAVYGYGMLGKGIQTCSGQIPIVEVTLDLESDALTAFVGNQGELPQALQHLISSDYYHTRVGKLSLPLQRILWQIVRCPYQGVTKRMYLEGKALEAIALILEEEREIQQGMRSQITLRADDVDRIHQAREILLNNLESPPSLMELARQVGLNDNALKRGFRQVFGKPVFGYLLDYRMEQAQQLLMTGEFKVGEVMQQVGFRSRKYFAEAFRKKFGANPKDYQMGNLRNSR